jgi:F-type H+-transporting ATPase subunit epsilon
MADLKLEIVTPTGKVLDTEASTITAPGANGQFGVLPDHRPALVMLGGGAITFEGKSGPGKVFIRGGVAEVRMDGVLVLADEAIRPDAVDRAEAEGVLKATDKAFATHDYLDDERVRRLESDRAYAESILKVAGH